MFLRRVRAVVADTPTGFLWVERGKLAASGYPASRSQVAWLQRAGVRSILTLTERPLPDAYVAGLNLETHHVAMEDHRPPSQESLRRAVDYIERQTAAGRPVLVHCLAGKGRTMCAIGAYLMETRGVTADQAIAELRSIRAGAVERGQEASLEEFGRSKGKTAADG